MGFNYIYYLRFTELVTTLQIYSVQYCPDSDTKLLLVDNMNPISKQ